MLVLCSTAWAASTLVAEALGFDAMTRKDLCDTAQPRGSAAVVTYGLSFSKQPRSYFGSSYLVVYTVTSGLLLQWGGCTSPSAGLPLLCIFGPDALALCLSQVTCWYGGHSSFIGSTKYEAAMQIRG